jgi:putative GTP pyrophosphokinase
MNLSCGSQGNFDFEAHRKSAVESYQRIRPIYEAFAETLKAILAQALERAHIKVASIEARAKSIDRFGVKASTPSNGDESRPKSSEPLKQITDLAGVRVITFFPRTVSQVD